MPLWGQISVASERNLSYFTNQLVNLIAEGLRIDASAALQPALPDLERERSAANYGDAWNERGPFRNQQGTMRAHMNGDNHFAKPEIASGAVLLDVLKSGTRHAPSLSWRESSCRNFVR